MTIDETDLGDSLTGIMLNLNLEKSDYDHDVLSSMTYPQLAAAKRDIEFTLETLFDLLNHKYKFDMHQPLVVNGFPRNDIDVVTIRLIRTKIIRLRNDHTYVLELLEVHLTEQLKSGNTPKLDNSATETERSRALVPFAIIRGVAAGGPAESSGLKLGDTITLFDSDVHAGNHNKLLVLASRVQGKIGQEIPVEVLRNGEKIEIKLVPRDNWGGRGVLGCHLVPF